MAAPEDDKNKKTFLASPWLNYFLFLVLWIWILQGLFPTGPRAVTFNEFLGMVRSGRVQSVQWGDTELRADAKFGIPYLNPDRIETVTTTQLAGVDQTSLMQSLLKRNIPVTGKIDKPSWFMQFLTSWLLPIALIFLIYSWVLSRVGGASAGPFGFGKSRAKLHDKQDKVRVTFEDVASLEEAKGELKEVVDFLQNPGKYLALGARIPRGVLLVGMPGTGKTLLARAVAGEADVPFFSLSGSDFIEMFVGVGAARVRDLFDQAKAHAPCIVFIDELDAIGKTRGGPGYSGAHDERDQTLNQLLSEMDGFDTSRGVILMAATNRPEVLDAALLRPGRFDRQVVLDPPDILGREAILKLHCRKIRLAEGLDLGVVARRTPGMVGADLANVVNEAALAAARRGSPQVDLPDLEEAIDRLQLGLKKRSTVMGEGEKRRVAAHEAGHTLVALSLPKADPVHRVTIIPRSIGALGATLQLPTNERHLITKEELADRLCVMFGGRAAEELVFGDVSTGARNDLDRATETARQMVCRFGMSDQLGPQTFGLSLEMKYLNTSFGQTEERNFSELTAQAIDGEIKRTLDRQYARAKEILGAKREMLDRIAAELFTKETLDRPELDRIMGVAPPSPPA